MPRLDRFQDISVAGSLSLGAQSTLEGNIIPDTDDLRNLGSSSKRFANIYAQDWSVDTFVGGSINNILFVDGETYATIAAAVTAASAGQKIVVRSLYAESPSSTITLDKALHLHFEAGVTVTSSATIVLEVTADNVTITGAGQSSKLTFNAAGTSGTPKKLIKFTAANDGRVSGLYLFGASTSAGTDPNALTDTGIELDTNSDALIENNIFEKLNIGVNGVGSDDSIVAKNVFRNIIGATNASTGYGVLISNGGQRNKVINNTLLGRNYPTNSSNVMRHGVYISSASSFNEVSGNYAEYALQAAYTTNSTAAQGVQRANKFIGNTAYLCVQADVATDAGINIFGFNRETLIAENIIDSCKGQGISIVGLSGDATNKNERNIVAGNHITSNNYAGISLEGVFENLIVGNYIYNNGQKTADTHSGIRLSQTPQGGSAVTGAPTNNRIKSNYVWGTQHKYAVDDQADHSGIANELTGNTLLTGATGAVNDANSALQMFANNSNAAASSGYEQNNYKPRFISANNLGFGLRNGLTNGDYFLGVTAASSPDLQISNNAGTLRATLTDAGDWTSRRHKANGTALVAGDFALHANFGSGATVSAISATDQGGRVTITTGTTAGAAPTATLTFKDGTWSTAPSVTVSKGDLVAPAAGNGEWRVTSVSATAAVFTFDGTPSDSTAYIFDFNVMGK